jgi:hypothetical protein
LINYYQVQCIPRLTFLVTRLTRRRCTDYYFSLTETESTVRSVPAHQVRHPPPPHPGRHQRVWRQDAPQVSISPYQHSTIFIQILRQILAIKGPIRYIRLASLEKHSKLIRNRKPVVPTTITFLIDCRFSIIM